MARPNGNSGGKNNGGKTKEPGSERIARRIARAGVCSRRDAEKLITAGRVVVNGVTLASPALNVSAKDVITIDGTPLPSAQPVRLWHHHKRKGRITSSRDPQGRPTIFDDLPSTLPRVITVGRHDFNSEGLLLLTNDGALARTLELPATGWIRRYRVRVHGRVDEAGLKGLAQGTTVDGVRYGPVDAKLERKTGTNAWLAMGLSEGKNREVRKLLASLGLDVTRLIRVSFGPFQLGRLAPGATIEVPAESLARQLGGLLPESASLPPPPPPKTTKTTLRLKATKGRKMRPGHAHHRRTS
ncbi:MAG: pseudouridine synthase [Alphaproteobacteria bacterium]|nr:pseudouridine synthase [Alphaproteobacteria bacterium]